MLSVKNESQGADPILVVFKFACLMLCLVLLGACANAAEPAAEPIRMVTTERPPPAATSGRASLRHAPSVLGQTVAELEESAHRAGVAVRVVAFQEGGTVTSQDPAPGLAVPADGYLVAWLGTPPTPEPVVAVADATALTVTPGSDRTESSGEARSADATVASATTVPASDPPVAAETPAPASARTSPGVSRSDGTPGGYANIRTLAPAETGLKLAGKASWYGNELVGSPVACGGSFDPAAATIATRELRCGTRVRVTGPTGAQAEATVTDWGPATWTGKRFDLSMAVFEHLAPLSRGWIEVELEVIGQAP